MTRSHAHREPTVRQILRESIERIAFVAVIVLVILVLGLDGVR